MTENEEWTPPREAGRVLKQDVVECMNEWGKTLKHFRIDRSPAVHDEITIARGIAQYGAEWVRLAVIGARKERGSENYDPARFVSLRTYLDPEKIERYVNQAAGAQSPDSGPRVGKLSPLKWIETPTGFRRAEE